MTIPTIFEQFDWSKIGADILSKFIEIILISLLFYLLNVFGQKLISRTTEHYLNKENTSNNRISTIRSLLKNGLLYTLLIFYIYTVLTVFGVPVGTLIASAGIASLAIGLGAQGFVNDIVTGFFILVEQQFEVGDLVTISDINGTVTAMGLRTTQVRSADGTLHYIPNRNISIVANFSRGHRQQIINLRIKSDTNIAELEKVLQQVNEQFYKSTDELLALPELLGVNVQANGSLIYQIKINPKQGAEIAMQRLLVSNYLPELKKVGITLPTNTINLQG
ncbi:mechanosensitive ion channel family protein [Lapidilactobacillus bayanensis]|uniref:mechanosensitive ion channel family protein n=1 Tax=Lapidilactobacillus bayanensis TaxID=2485998 RepID=UPI0013DE55B4|nr:mechanosensitive ion channel family protein [Lapidilactobacillus bayanensis]